MKSRVEFLAFFLIVAFIMKVVGEFIHEVMGHGLFVLLFGGEIIRVHISLLWPYKLSGIGHRPPSGGFEVWQETWIDGGGILVCLIVSCALQALLLLAVVKDWRFSSTLFWLSFWTFLNPTGYLIMGGIKPFGDIWELINDGVLTQSSSIVLGLIIFLAAFFSLSKTFRDILLSAGMIRDIRELRISLSLFWLVIPLTTAMALIGLRFLSHSLFYMPMSFTPSMLALFIPSIPQMRLPRD